MELMDKSVRRTKSRVTLLAALLSLSFSVWGQISSCDLNGDGVVDSDDVTVAVDMALGTKPCTANIEGSATCTLVTVQRVINASEGRACVVYGAPLVTSAITTSGTLGNAFSYQVRATNTPTSYSAAGLPAGLSIDAATGLISGTPTSTGAFMFTVAAVNRRGAGNATLTLTITDTPPPITGATSAAPSSLAQEIRRRVPAITSPTSASGTVGIAFLYQITATNSPSSYGATGLPAGLSVNTTTGRISGTPTANGTSAVTLSATNGHGTGHATLTLTISSAAPVITSATSASGTVGSTFSYQITATNSPPAQATVRQVYLPAYR